MARAPVDRRRPRGLRERGLRRGPDRAVAREPEPLLERDDARRRPRAGLPVHRVAGQEAELVEALLNRTDLVGLAARRRRRGRRRRRDVRRCDRLRSDRIAGDDAGEEPERGAALDEQLDRADARVARRGQDDLGDAGGEALDVRPGCELLPEVDRRDSAGDAHRPERRRGGICVVNSRFFSDAVGPANTARSAASSEEPGRSTYPTCSPWRNATLTFGVAADEPPTARERVTATIETRTRMGAALDRT